MQKNVTCVSVPLVFEGWDEWGVLYPPGEGEGSPLELCQRMDKVGEIVPWEPGTWVWEVTG